MTVFDHYLYVLECEDGSLYTGYTTDVQARLAAHKAGTGAKYTKSHKPVNLVAQARFYSKPRALSAEAHFKQLDREQKNALLAQAATMPFEDVLRARLPGFPEDTAPEFVCRSLAENADADYRTFQLKLLPTVDPRTFIGVRTPVLRTIAKQLMKRTDANAFLTSLPHRLFDENQVHSFAIGLEKDYDTALKHYEAFLPYVDNWATCDQLSVKPLAQNPGRTLEHVDTWMDSGKCYTIRFALDVLMKLFLDDLFEERFLAMVAATTMPDSPEEPAAGTDTYYVNMMRAWYFAEALIKQEAATLPYFELTGKAALLDEWTRRKAIQKAIESRRIPADLKEHLRACR